MRKNTVGVSCAVLVALAGSVASAQSLVVETWSGTTMDTLNPHSSGAAFTIPLTSTTSRINLYSTSGLANIGTISFSGSTSVAIVDVVIGSGALNTDPESNLPNAAQDWGGVSFPFSARLSGAIAGDLTGAINPDSIVRLEVHGEVSAPITVSAASGTVVGVLQLGSTTSAGTFTAGNASTTGGDVFAIEGGSGPLAGAILVGGKLENLICAGDIAIAANPGISARDGIDTIQAGDIAAVIVANAGESIGHVNSIECGSFTGSLSAYWLRKFTGQSINSPGITIDGDLDGVLHFGHDVLRSIHVTGAFLEGSAVRVGGTLGASVTANGFVTEISVDGAVSLSSTGVGPITLGSLSDDVGSISSVLGFQRDDNRAGPEVIFTAAQRIGSIVGGPPGGVNTDVINGLLAAPEVGTILARGVMRLDFYLENFQHIEVWDAFGWDSQDIENVQLGGAGLFVIGGTCGAELRFGPSDDFTGQMIVNAWNESAGWNYPAAFWDPVLAEFVETDPHPYYENFGTEEVMPGGAIGLVPFHLHRTLCEPPHAPDGTCDYTLPTRVWPSSHGGGTRETIVIRHYGPVFDGEDGSEEDDVATNPLVIERRSVVLCFPTPCEGEEPEWTDRSSHFDVYVLPGLAREVWVARKLVDSEPQAIGTAYRLRVSPRAMGSTTQLRSAMTFLSDVDAPGVGGYPYEWNPVCEALHGPTPPPPGQ